jgi:two-component system cell cycle sensor histidine kinase/response regulator CckA
MVISELINNLALLLALGVLYSLLVRTAWGDSPGGKILMGLLFGGMCFMVMLMPMTLMPGLIFDTRSVVVSLAGLFGGPVVAGIAVAVGSGLRIWLGGVGTLAGVVGIVWVGFAGVMYRRMIGEQTGSLSLVRIYVFGLLAQAGQVATILLLPSDIVWPAMQKMALPMMLVLPVGIVILGVLLSDVQSRLDSERALKASEKRLRDILDYSPATIYIKGLDYRYRLVNKEFLSKYGFEMDEVIGHTSADIWNADIGDQLNKHDARVIETGHMIEEIETVQNKEGEIKQLISIKFPLRDENDEIYALCGISTDITQRLQAEKEKRLLEERLVQAEKMEAIGTLAGGIAHDFNNILSAVLGYSELAMLEAKQNRDNQSHLAKVIDAGMRARDLVKQILSFSRHHEPERKYVDMKELLDETMGLMRASLPSTIEIKKAIPHQLPEIYADPTQLHQVIMNLCSNAAHAMQQSGGCLSLSIEHINMDEQAARKHAGLEPGAYLKLDVSDTGCGMPPDIVDKVFEPFYTTKDEGEGTGMGLSVVHGIIKNHDGGISFSSEPDRGSTFTIFLPVREAGEHDDRAEDEDAPLPTGSERVLFLDDEDAIVEFAIETLANLGYQAVGLSSSEETLRLLEKPSNSYDLLITDMTMPRMTGLELARKVQKIMPGLPIILCSGQAQQISAEELESAGIKKLLTKPVTMRRLASSVREVLDAS